MARTPAPLAFESYTRHNVHQFKGFTLVVSTDRGHIIDVVSYIDDQKIRLEKDLEHLNYEQGLLHLVVSTFSNSVLSPIVYAWILAYERSCDQVPSPLDMYIRMTLSEIHRILTHGHNICALSSLLESKVIQDRFHSSLQDIRFLTQKFLKFDWIAIHPFIQISSRDTFVKGLKKVHRITQNLINDVDRFLTHPVIEDRLISLGVLSQKNGIDFGLSGPILRACGVERDSRRYTPYDDYQSLRFEVTLRSNGDCLDRYRIRHDDIKQSASLLKQCVERIESTADDAPFLTSTIPLYHLTSPTALTTSIKQVIQGERPGPGELYCFVEGPRGEEGVFWISNGTSFPARAHLRAPGLSILNVLPILLKENDITDVPLILNSLDIHI